MAAKQRFPYPWEVATPPGAEGWEQMYPYYLLSHPETRELERSLFWFADKMHHPHPYYPFDIITFEAWGLACAQNSTRIFALPPSLGIEHRIVNGYLYIAPVPVQDPAEVERRAAAFQKRAGYYYTNWNDLYAKWRTKCEQVIHDMEGLQFNSLPDLEPEEVVFTGKGRSSAFDLLETYQRLIQDFFLVWQYHFEMLNVGYAAYLTFFQLCKQLFPSILDQTIARMVAGIDVILFRPDEELKKLARRAVELGVTAPFLSGAKPQEVLAALESTPPGRQWLEDLDKARYPWFYYSTEYGFYHDQLSWIDDLSIPFGAIRDYIRRLQAGEDLSRPTDRLRAERDALADEYRSLLHSSAERQQFDQLLNLSRTVFPYIEEHNFYVEHWAHTVFWRKMRQLGRVLCEGGFFADPEDLFYLNRHELAEALFDFVSAWAVGVPVRGRQRWRDEVARRREILEALRAWSPLPCLGEPPEVVTDPFAVMNYGITSERVKEWLGGVTEKAALSGMPASPGVAEGPARVIRSEKEIDQVQPGEILVCPITAPSWAPLFSRVAGVVTDIGGMMCHAAIVCREYGVPAVVGVGFGTTSIRTGQRLRVDGNRGTVEVLSG